MVYTQHHTFGPADEGGIRWMEHFDPPKFMFDPHSLGTLFYPFTRAVGGLGYDSDVTERVIAPVPEKAEGLRREFVASVRTRALDLLLTHPTLVGIGYSFAESDRDTYAELLDALSRHQSPRVILVVPEAVPLAGRLREEFPKIAWEPQPMAFAEWAANGYPGLAGGRSGAIARPWSSACRPTVPPLKGAAPGGKLSTDPEIMTELVTLGRGERVRGVVPDDVVTIVDAQDAGTRNAHGDRELPHLKFEQAGFEHE